MYATAAEVDDERQKLQSAEQKLRELKEQLEERTAAITMIAAHDVERETSRWLDEKARFEAKDEQLNKRIVELTSQCKQLSEDNAKERQEREALQHEIDQLKLKGVLLDGERKRAFDEHRRRKRQRKDDEQAALDEASTRSNREADRAWEEGKPASRKSKAKSKRELELERERDEAIEGRERAQRDLDAMWRQYKDKERERNEMESRLGSTEEQLVKAHDELHRVEEQWHHDEAELRTLLEEEEIRHHVHEHMVQSAARLRSAAKDAKLHLMVEAMAKRVDEAGDDEAAALRERLAVAEAQLTSARAREKQLEKQAHGERDVRSELETQIDVLQGELEETQAAQRSLVKDNKDLKHTNMIITTMRNDLRDKLNKLEKA